MEESNDFRVLNPVFYSPIREKPLGLFAVITLMSNSGYGLIACMESDEDDIDDIDTEELRENIAIPLMEQMPDFIQAYQLCMQSVVAGFPNFSMNVPFSFCLVDGDKLQFALPDGSSLGRNSATPVRYVFIAPEGVNFVDFVLTPRSIN